MMPILRVLSLLLLVTSLTGQDDRLSEREREMEKRIQAREADKDSPEAREFADKQRALRAERGEKEDLSEEARSMKEAEELSRLTPEERLARMVHTNASAYCRFVAAVKPQKLMPGQSGVIVVSALLNGQAVLPSPAPMEMIGARQQGFVSLGEPGFHPADLARQAAGYAGRPVYDNYAIFEVPVTIAADAKVGDKQAVVLDLRFDIYDGASAQPIGRFVDRAHTEVEVGRPADPIVQGGAARGPASEASGATSTAPAPANAGAAPAPAASEEQVLRGQEPAVPAAPIDSAPAESQPPAGDAGWSPPADDGGMLPLPVWIGGGALLLVIVLMLARKK